MRINNHKPIKIMAYIALAGLIISYPASAPDNILQLPKVTAGENSFKSLTPTPTPAIIITPKSTPSPTPAPRAYPKPEDLIGHKDLDCEKMAKDAQERYGGSLVFLVGKDENGQYIKGPFAGHWINKVYVKELNKIQYIDYQNQLVYDDLEMMERDFRSAKGYAAVESFDMEEGRPPFNLIWHY